MKKKAQKKKRLVIDMPIETHNEIKNLAEKRNCSMKYYVMKVLARVMRDEKSYD
jgi:hypothetical protein